MKNLKALLVIAAVAFAALPATAQQKRVSPQEVVHAVVDDNHLTLTYCRPFIKDPKSGEPRKIWGGLVPYGKVWRTGANEATTLVTEKALKIGETEIPAGTYTLFTLPNADGTAKLIVNKQTGQWGTNHDEKQDLARVDLKKSDLEAAVDQFTMVIEKNSTGGGTLKMSWEKTQYSVAFTVQK